MVPQFARCTDKSDVMKVITVEQNKDYSDESVPSLALFSKEVRLCFVLTADKAFHISQDEYFEEYCKNMFY